MSERGHTAVPNDASWSDLVQTSLPGLIWSTDTALRIATCQGADLQRVCEQGRDLVGTSLFELFATENIDYGPIAAHCSALRGERCPVAFTLAGTSYRGIVAPMQTGEKIAGCVTTAFALPSFESRCEAITATTADLILFLRPDGVIEDVNRTATGSPRERVIGKTVFEFTPQRDHERLREMMDDVLRTGVMATLKICFPRRFGTPAWQTMRIGPIRKAATNVGLVLIATDITQHKHAVEKLKAEEVLLRDLLELQDRERRLVAYEIHDGFIQDVVGGRMIIQGIRQTLLEVDPDLHKRLDTTVSLMARAINEGRRLISELRPMIIDEMGLVDAIDYLIGEEEARGDIDIHFAHRMEIDRLSPLLQATIFRIIREAITNARRHGHATHIDIRLTQIGTQHLIIEVQDNGKGFDPSQVPADRFGLSGIRERARLFGGGSSIESSPTSGTRITVKVAIGEPTHVSQPDQPNWTWTV